MINQDKWDDIYKKYPVADGDFVYLPAGCLHAMGKGNVVYEIQQSTDVTYRFMIIIEKIKMEMKENYI